MRKTTSSTKNIVLLTALIFTCNTVSAQVDWSKSRLGFRVSPSIAWLKANSSGLSSNGSNVGFGYGIIADFGFTDNYAFGTGVEICYKGGAIAGTVTSGTSTIAYEQTCNLQYVEIPLTLKLRTNQIGYLKYYGQFGVSAAFNFNSGGETKENGKVVDNPNINKFNAAMVIAGGVEYPVTGNTALIGGLTFNNGFVNILDNAYGSKAITNYLALNIGIIF